MSGVADLLAAISATPGLIALVAFTYLLGGFSKGALGLGMPIIALAILATFIGVKDTMAISLLPSITTSIYQAFVGPAFFELLRRLWLFFVTSIIGILIGVGILAVASKALLLGLLGSVLVVYALYSLFTPQIAPPGRHESWLTPVCGSLGGLMFGMTGTFIVPGLVYLQALGFKKDVLVQAMGMTFLVIMITLALAFTDRGFFPKEMASLSAFAVVPAFAGIWLGLRIRHRISEAQFRRFFFMALLIVGLYQLYRAFG